MKIEDLHAVPFFPAMRDRAAWEAVLRRPPVRKFAAEVAAEAEAFLEQPIVEMPATAFLDFYRTGDRVGGEAVYFARRRRLVTLMLAEALEYKGRFLDGIVNAVWATLNEPTWSLPAHTRLPAEDALPDLATEMVDLFSAQTSSILCSVLMLAEPELAAVSPSLVRRMRRILADRAIRPIEEDISRFWWIEGVNNWTPWICANLLSCADTLLADDPARLTEYARIVQPCMDRYYARYSDDGGGDEGPSYWIHSPGISILYYELLYRMSGGKCSIFGEEKYAKMIRYIRDMWIADARFLPFSDGLLELFLPCGCVAMYARRTGDEELLDFIRRFRQANPRTARYNRELNMYLADLFCEDDGPAGPATDFVSYYPELRQLSVRAGRLRFAAVAWHNGVSHNHNDVGQFIFAVDGDLQILDLGGPEYTRFTFSDRRYEDPIINSLYHNVPVFDGVGQSAGREYGARDVEFRREGTKIIFAMDLAPAYPAELELDFCRRTMTLDTGAQTLDVRDEWQASKPHSYALTLFSPKPSAEQCTELASGLPVAEAGFAVTDLKQRRNWGERLWTRKLASAPALSGANTLRFTLRS